MPASSCRPLMMVTSLEQRKSEIMYEGCCRWVWLF